MNAIKGSAGVVGPIAALICIIGLGCADTKGPSTQPQSVRDRQDEALRDPYGYNGGDMPSVTGGKINEFDKQGFKRDVDHVLNP